MTVAVIWYFIPGGFKHCRTDSAKNSLPSYLWRNGTIHFIVLLFLNLADMVLDVMKILFPEAGSSIEVYSPLPLLIFPITSIIISRFTLQLCKLYVTAQNAEQSLIVPTHSEEPTTTVPSMGPYTSINLNMNASPQIRTRLRNWAPYWGSQRTSRPKTVKLW
ncbi:uncharacterized protein B0H18DRAFT_1126748 [Fomitopsis serialis]|uniref:uncharacterized protein n=1 Tax=Fomitopsis serialis TaxID=139415 RepID=UPI0020081208|nr:uncharacterized protein B0H18DRAFT_1126748 [Neoantrodia serialis]KAH9912840.1 hypothetical protein B0H18DRAFT_1126748 [Neoantrodia serialis]